MRFEYRHAFGISTPIHILNEIFYKSPTIDIVHGKIITHTYIFF